MTESEGPQIKQVVLAQGAKPRRQDFERVGRYAVGWLAVSGLVGPALGVVAGTWWSAQWGVAVGVSVVAVCWGFLGTLSLASAHTTRWVSTRIEHAALVRQVASGRAEPERGAVALVPKKTDGALSAGQLEGALSAGASRGDEASIALLARGVPYARHVENIVESRSSRRDHPVGRRDRDLVRDGPPSAQSTD